MNEQQVGPEQVVPAHQVDQVLGAAMDRRLQAAGWRVVRITWRQLHDEPREVAAQLRALLVTAHATPAAARPAPSG